MASSAPLPSSSPVFQDTNSNSLLSADTDIAEEGSSEFITTLVLNFFLGFLLWGLFEIKRNKRSVYAPRRGKLPHRAPPPLPYGPLRWVWSVATMPGPEALNLAGMDAYCLLRFHWLCFRMCLFASFWGMFVLTPIYFYSGGDAEDMYVLTLANVSSGSDNLWVTVVFAYLFTWHALYVLRGEHKVFAEMREEYLTEGDPDFATQTRYTSKVENVPATLRSAVALEAYFDDLFPGQVHSAVMCLNMPALEGKVLKREILADKLEKARAHEAVDGTVVHHRERRFPGDFVGRKSGLTLEEYLIVELGKLNEEITIEQKSFLNAAQELNSLDDRLMNEGGPASSEGQDKTSEEGERKTDGASPRSNSFLQSTFRGPSGAQGSKLALLMKTKSKWTSDLTLRSDVPEGPAGSPAEHQRQQQQQQSVAAVSSTSGVEEESDGRKPSKYGTIVDPELNSSLPPPVDDEDDQSRVSGLRESAPDIAKEALSSITHVGDAAIKATQEVAKGLQYLTLGQRMSNTGFVTFRQMAACATSRQVLLAPRPHWCDCEPAPDPRDVVWPNIAVSQDQSEARHQVAALALAVGAIFWSIPVALVQVWASFGELEKIFPWLSNLSTDSILYSLISGYLPVVALLLLMMVLPFLFQMLSYRYERRKSHSEVQRLVLARYFTYQVANIYVTVASGSITTALEAILSDPISISAILGDTFPAVAVYFLDLIIVKIFFGLPFELLRGWPLFRVVWAQRCTNRAYATAREIRNGPFGDAELLYGWVYPTLLLVLVVCFIYAVISPFIMPAGAVFFALSYLTYKHQVLYVYVPKYESGGVFWFSVYPRVLIGLGLAQLTLAGYVYVRSGYPQATCILPLPVFIYWYGYRSYQTYLRPSECVSMETAVRTDRQDASAAAAASANQRFSSRPNRLWQGLGRKGEREAVNPDEFEPLLYAQLALTSPEVEPDDCSPRREPTRGTSEPKSNGDEEAREAPKHTTYCDGTARTMPGNRDGDQAAATTLPAARLDARSGYFDGDGAGGGASKKSRDRPHNVERGPGSLFLPETDESPTGGRASKAPGRRAEAEIEMAVKGVAESMEGSAVAENIAHGKDTAEMAKDFSAPPTIGGSTHTLMGSDGWKDPREGWPSDQDRYIEENTEIAETAGVPRQEVSRNQGRDLAENAAVHEDAVVVSAPMPSAAPSLALLNALDQVETDVEADVENPPLTGGEEQEIEHGAPLASNGMLVSSTPLAGRSRDAGGTALP